MAEPGREPVHRVIDVNGYPTRYAVAGEGPPLLYLHGEGTTSAWGAAHDALANSFRVIAPVHPGFGGSELPDWLDGVDDLAFHYIDLMAALALARPVVVGESLGGWVTLDLGVHRPDLLGAVVLVGALGLRCEGGMVDLFMKEPPDLLATLSATMPAERYDPMTGDVDALTALWVDMAAVARLMWERPYDTSFERRAHHLSCPALVVWGAEDRLLPVSHGERLARLIGAAAPTVVAGSGHLVSLDAPAELAEAVATWRSHHT